MSSLLKENLAKAIKEQRLSIAELERKADLTKNSVLSILNGHTKNPTAKTLQKIADFLGCTVKDLLENEEFSTQKFHTSQRPLLSPAQAEKKIIYLEDHDLYLEISSYLTQYLKNKNAKPDLNSLFQSITEIYTFCYFKNDKNLDRRFADWSIEKIL